LTYAAVLLATAPGVAAAQACLGHPVEDRRVAVAAHYAQLDGAHGFGAEAAARVLGPLFLAAHVARRDFETGSETLTTLRADAAFVTQILGVSVCPTVGLVREDLGELEITLIPAGVGLSVAMPLGRVRLIPYVIPGAVRSRARVLGSTRQTTDFDLRLGANLQLGRYYVGTGWQRRFTEAVDGALLVRAGLTF
jgi:hypothetical protein